MDWSLKSQCPVVTGLWAGEEHHRVHTADQLRYIVCLRHPDSWLLLALQGTRKEEQQQKSGCFLTVWHCAFYWFPGSSFPCKYSTARRTWKGMGKVASAGHSLRFAPHLLKSGETVSGYPPLHASASHVTDSRIHVLTDV